MTSTEHSKQGSALLVVLGFLAFMIVSAVTFAIYMREERMPSSALRRTVATRQLVKAALARAISRVDDAVRDDPFPGLSARANPYKNPKSGGKMDNWEGRVFMPPGSESGDDLYSAPLRETVSTLTLEGLGYVPPPLVNDVRFLSRSSWAAQWQPLPYDAGRVAFCAVNVSDFLDVTRLFANKPRSATASGRISLAYLLDPNFDPSNTTGCRVDGFGVTPKNFDEKVHENREGGNDSQRISKDAPFVSMLDFQLAMYNGLPGVMDSLFYQWLKDGHGGNGSTYYEKGDEYFKYANRQPFVTESCATNQSWLVDITREDGQPFKDSIMQTKDISISAMYNGMNDSWISNFEAKQPANSRMKLVNGPDTTPMFFACLFDYLDHDSVPISLAMPCVERVPMFCVIDPSGMQLSPTRPAGGEAAGDESVWKIDLSSWLSSRNFGASVVFPFKRNSLRGITAKSSFKYQAFARMVLVEDETGDDYKNKRRANGDYYTEQFYKMIYPQRSDWDGDGDAMKLGGTSGVFAFSLKANGILDNDISDPADDDQAGTNVRFQFSIPNGLQPVDFIKKTTERRNPGGDVTYYTYNLVPLFKDGTLGGIAPGSKYNETSAEVRKLQQGKFRPHLYVWVRVLDKDNKTVDLVPATLEDDNDLNGINNGNLNRGGGGAMTKNCGRRADGPLLRFTPDMAAFSYQEMINGGMPVGARAWREPAFACLDPRFNWAPEDWYVVTDGGMNWAKWLEEVNKFLRSGDAMERRADTDIFMAASDQGFLQSLGEFAFIPRVTNPANGVVQVCGTYDGKLREKLEETANVKCAWCTYSVDREFYDYMTECGIGRDTSKECLVNPYTSELSILMAALANTPCDYWCAGMCANTKDEKKEHELKQKYGGGVAGATELKDANEAITKRFVFSEATGMRGSDLIKIASAMKTRFNDSSLLRSAVEGDKGYNGNLSKLAMCDAWKAVYDDYGANEREQWQLKWWADPNTPASFTKLFDVDLQNQVLHGIDRKFLYTYWRDCFENQQQLFLLFVRAESSALGGTGEGTPSQKGGRAVALVWRNPRPTSPGAGSSQDGQNDDEQNEYIEERRPHQTRVLFYHQLD